MSPRIKSKLNCRWHSWYFLVKYCHAAKRHHVEVDQINQERQHYKRSGTVQAVAQDSVPDGCIRQGWFWGVDRIHDFFVFSERLIFDFCTNLHLLPYRCPNCYDYFFVFTDKIPPDEGFSPNFAERIWFEGLPQRILPAPEILNGFFILDFVVGGHFKSPSIVFYLTFRRKCLIRKNSITLSSAG